MTCMYVNVKMPNTQKFYKALMTFLHNLYSDLNIMDVTNKLIWSLVNVSFHSYHSEQKFSFNKFDMSLTILTGSKKEFLSFFFFR